MATCRRIICSDQSTALWTSVSFGDISRHSTVKPAGPRWIPSGKSFESLLAGVSFTRARELLGSGMGATEVAFELGYSDPAHFSRAFRRWAGAPPREWQRKE